MIEVYRNTVEFIIPNRDRSGKEVDSKPVLTSLFEAIGAIGLGVSQRSEDGIWINSDGEAVCERNRVLRVSFSAPLWPEIVAVIMRFVALGVLELKQAELALYVNGTLVIVSSDSDRNADVAKGAGVTSESDRIRTSEYVYTTLDGMNNF
ncbi:MAG: hypothetical protein IIB00_09725 [candidate division Zixibacteria bacterium]|nr:hypothetical protein [candidate division Zixibacteria bacterium]